MIEKNDIIKMAKHVFKRSKGVPDRALMHPKRDWILGLGLFTIVLLGGGVVSAYHYNLYNAIEVSSGDVPVKIVRYQTNVVTKAINYFSEREAAYQSERSIVPTRVISPPATEAPGVLADETDTATELPVDEVDIEIETTEAPETTDPPPTVPTELLVD